ncbi:MarR family winged helix-turn-helix transcriptional regulator [Candidimonas nitroreducens]|uniref:MarR family transcriptional regulator n=1 Tax=Candidimonas nitroreducens TaxID=683354 RepID=A0A225M6E9_9BURK|nr:MarR family transcriptional regulator [Candidimonas nitroreducens]OWT56914.1 MarR family transcriptional regulator [Candidimonas nitroreducens]
MPTPIPEAAVIDFVQALGMLVRRMRAAAATQELSLTESVVMARLEREGPATIAELARAEGMKPQSMGAAVATLEDRGIVERRPHPTDGRQQHIRLTTRGAAVRKSTGDAKRSWLAQSMSRLDAADRDTLLAAGRIMRRLAESE